MIKGRQYKRIIFLLYYYYIIIRIDNFIRHIRAIENISSNSLFARTGYVKPI